MQITSWKWTGSTQAVWNFCLSLDVCLNHLWKVTRISHLHLNPEKKKIDSQPGEKGNNQLIPTSIKAIRFVFVSQPERMLCAIQDEEDRTACSFTPRTDWLASVIASLNGGTIESFLSISAPPAQTAADSYLIYFHWPRGWISCQAHSHLIPAFYVTDPAWSM